MHDRNGEAVRPGTGRTLSARVREGQGRLPRNSATWLAQADGWPGTLSVLPCQPQTQVTVCARCLYSSIRA